MNIKYEPGMLISLYENDNEKYCVIKSIEIEDEQYLLLQLVDDEEELTKLDIDKLYIIKLNKFQEDFEFVKENDLIEKILIEALKEENS